MTSPIPAKESSLDALNAPSLDDAREAIVSHARSGRPDVAIVDVNRFLIGDLFVVTGGGPGWSEFAEGATKASALGVSVGPIVAKRWDYPDGVAYAFQIDGSYRELTPVENIGVIPLASRNDCFNDVAILAQHGLLLDVPRGNFRFSLSADRGKLLMLEDWDRLREGSQDETTQFLGNLRRALALDS